MKDQRERVLAFDTPTGQERIAGKVVKFGGEWVLYRELVRRLHLHFNRMAWSLQADILRWCVEQDVKWILVYAVDELALYRVSVADFDKHGERDAESKREGAEVYLPLELWSREERAKPKLPWLTIKERVGAQQVGLKV